MAVLVVRLGENQYVQWSNTADAPVSFVMSRSELLRHLESEERLTFSEADHLVAIADATGTSDPHLTVEALLTTNRAGINESKLSLSEILREYRHPR